MTRSAVVRSTIPALGLMAAAMWWVPSPASAQSAEAGAAARAALERRCAGCHHASPEHPGASAGGIADILALDRVRADPTLVRPGSPDASPLYTSLAGAHPHPPAGGGATTAEIAAVAQWIAALPRPPEPGCPERVRITTTDLANIAGDALAAAGKLATRVRFISLAHVWNACLPEAEVAAYARAVGRLLGGMAKRSDAAGPVALDPARTLLAVPLETLGWPAGTWDLLAREVTARFASARAVSLALPAPVRASTGTDWPVLPADALAATLLARDGFVMPPAETPERIRGFDPVDALVVLHARPLDLERAAAELGSTPALLRARLDRIISQLKPAARRLRQGLVTRAEQDGLAAEIAAQAEGPPGAPTPPVSALTGQPAAGDGALRLSLWSERDSYTAGETATFYAAASRPCHLTLVSVDAAGRAIVLLPSDVDGDNLLTQGRELQVPSVDAPYRLRVNAPGRETIIGLCSPNRRTARGVQPDYEQQRFTILGDWRAFDAAANGSDADPARARPRPDARVPPQRRRARPPGDGERSPTGPDELARAAMTYEVK